MDKKGLTQVQNAAMVLVVAMVLSVVLLYARFTTILQRCQDNAQMVLDSYVITHAKEIYNAVKNGNNQMDGVELEQYKINISEQMGLDISGNHLYNKGEQGEVIFAFTNLSIANQESLLKLRSTYDVTIPVVFGGRELFDMTIAQGVTSYYTLKSDS